MNCRACGADKQTTPLCGKCLLKVKDLCTSAHDVMPLMGDEIAKETAKARLGGGGGDGAPDVISFHALEARDNLKATIKALQSRARMGANGEPMTLQANLWRLQRRTSLTWEKDPLGHLLDELTDRVRDCWRIVDQRQEKTTAGHCTQCGHLIRAAQGTEIVRCPGCGHSDQTQTIKDRLREETLDRLNGSMLTATEMVVAAAQLGETLKEQTIRGWHKKGWLSRDAQKRYLFDDVWELMETPTQKRRDTPIKSTR